MLRTALALCLLASVQGFSGPAVGAFTSVSKPAAAWKSSSFNNAMRLQTKQAPKIRARHNAVSPSMEFLAPPQIYEAVATAGATKAKMPIWKTFYMGILAGAYIAFGSCLALTVGGAVPAVVASGNVGIQKILLGAFGLPTGLMMVVTAGGELFTGNTAFLAAAMAEGKATIGDYIKSCSVSWLGNLVGSVGLAYLVFSSGALAPASVATAKAMATAKTTLAFWPAVFRGILCNWLVCMGIWQATAAKDIVSKAIAIWLPISAFVTMGFEHSVANMFFLPMGIFQGAEVSWSAVFLNNLLPVSIGNAIAGSIFLAFSYSLMFGTPGKKLSGTA